MNSEIQLVCFDLDDTLITHNSWKELGVALGVTLEQDQQYFQEYMDGHINNDQWNEKLLQIYKLHDDASRDGISHILSKYTYAPHARQAVAYVQSQGYKVALVSGSIDILVSMVAKELGIEDHKANHTMVFGEDGRLSTILSGGNDTLAKLGYLEAIAEELSVPLSACACIGDGANDIEMFKKTNRGITFTGSPIEKCAWKVIDTLSDIESIL
ncbi:MAG: putative phosphoserine phosphatase [Candidatus Kaiserbacteria bacterium]|nr:putative phosphoserine phosphatase [Candidatus Kaiserbacteria bacterium]